MGTYGCARVKQKQNKKALTFPKMLNVLVFLNSKKNLKSVSNYSCLRGNSPKFPQLGDWSESQMCTSDFMSQASPLISFKPFSKFLSQHHRKKLVRCVYFWHAYEYKYSGLGF